MNEPACATESARGHGIPRDQHAALREKWSNSTRVVSSAILKCPALFPD